MHHRDLYRNGPDVTEIGFGTWGIGGGWGPRDDARSRTALHAAIDTGINFIDTAYMYGEGHAESLIGQVLRERSETVRVATKVPPQNRLFPAPGGTPVDDAYPRGLLTHHTQQSLTALGLETLDLQQLHVWSPDWLHRGGWADEVADLKADGLIQAFGISINDHQPGSALDLVHTGLVDTVQVIYNIFDQSPEDQLLDACHANGVGVIVRVALDEGGLTGAIRPGMSFDAEDWRANYFRGNRPSEVARRVQAIIDDLQINVDELPEVALRYVLSHPAVSSVIVGMRSPERVQQNVPVADGLGLPDNQRERLCAHRWTRNYYDPDTPE